MDHQKPLYRSKGVPAKGKLIFQVLMIVCGIIGIICLLLPLFSDAPWLFSLIGIIYLGLACMLPKSYYRLCNSRLTIYDDCITGIAISCIEQNSESLFPELSQLRTMNDPEKCKFQLDYSGISDIQTMKIAMPQITIVYGDTKYTISVKDPDKAYQILCDNVFGPVAAKNCINCGCEISAIAENCPHCGHMTRYGKQQKDSTQIRINTNKMQLQLVIGAVITVIGLFIMIPALIDLNEISSYAGLYASIFPSRSRKIVARFILGLFVTICGICTPVSRIIINKINPKQE